MGLRRWFGLDAPGRNSDPERLRGRPPFRNPPPPSVPCDVPSLYRFNVVHSHAGVDYKPGDRCWLTAAEVASVRKFAGERALERDDLTFS